MIKNLHVKGFSCPRCQLGITQYVMKSKGHLIASYLHWIFREGKDLTIVTKNYKENHILKCERCGQLMFMKGV